MKIKLKLVSKFTRASVEQDTDYLYVFGDNLSDSENGYVPSYTQAVIRGLPNAIGICTKRDRYTRDGSYLNDGDFGWFTAHVDYVMNQIRNSGKGIALPLMSIGTGRAKLKEKSPKCYQYLMEALRGLIDEFELVQS